MTVTLQFSTEEGLGSHAIRWFTHSDYSHVDVVWPDADGSLYGARFNGGVKLRPADYATFTKRTRVVIPCSESQSKAFYLFLKEQEHKQYDFAAILGFAMARDWRRDDDWFCSELVTAALIEAVIVRVATPANRITPNDCFLLAASVSSSVF